MAHIISLPSPSFMTFVFLVACTGHIAMEFIVWKKWGYNNFNCVTLKTDSNDNSSLINTIIFFFFAKLSSHSFHVLLTRFKGLQPV